LGQLFGTDGVRGVANTEISCELAMDLGRAAATVIAERTKRRPAVLVGKDTRISSDMLEAAVTAGLCSVGADVIQVGVVPTPALAYLVWQGKADGGIMLSASHNPYEFNGIKIFGPDGKKLTDGEESAIEAMVRSKEAPYPVCRGKEIGKIEEDGALVDTYIEHIAGTAGSGLGKYKVVVDCANGCAAQTAEKLFRRIGIEAEILNAASNGININEGCGSTHIEHLSEIVLKGDYDIGISYDGDADRCLLVDENGKVLDGDTILAILSDDFKRRGKLKSNVLVCTVMSNLGLFEYAGSSGIKLETTKVGDRHVLARINEKNYSMGGEQSGHIILADHMPTGDGQLTSVQILRVMCESGKKLSRLAGMMRRYPQAIKNIRADDAMKAKMQDDPEIKRMIIEAEKRLGKDGRVLVRSSGTEPLVRVMIEGKSEEQAERLASGLADRLEKRLLEFVR